MTAELLGSQAPRVCLTPPYVRTLGPEASELAARAGLVLDHHQRLVIDAMLGFREDGKFAAFEVGLVEPRQNGKGGILEARELAGVELLEERLLIHSAHEYATALEAFYRMTALVEEAGLKVQRVRNAHGEQGIDFANGCRLRYRTRTRGGGRGFSCDFLGLDEAMVLPEFAHSALLPTMSARPNPQVAYAASAVDQEVHEHGVVLARVRERGLAGDETGGLAYFEWSLPFEHPDEVPQEVAADPERWALVNPALGSRISVEHVGHERESMSRRSFAVERLGVGDWPATDGAGSTVIRLERWNELADVGSQVSGQVAFAFDVSPDRSRASIAAAGRRSDRLLHLEVVDRRPGTGWLVERLAELVGRHAPSHVVCDAVGPAGSLLPELEQAGVRALSVSSREHAQACGVLFDAVERGTVRHLGTDELVAAIRGAAKRPLGDAWAWSRKSSSVDISPLVAVTLALWAAAGHVPRPEPWAASW